jgi:CRP/FNR family transcriptional regulator, cyclic AMP receptor protein
MATASPRPPELRAASLFDVDPELGEALDPEQLRYARARAIIAVLDVTAGPWTPPVLEDSHPFALLIVDGLVMREQILAGSTASDALGPGDVVELEPPRDELVPSVVHWTVPDRVTVAVLDDRVLGVLRTWPVVGRMLLARSVRRAGRLATHRAISQLPRVDQRLLAYFAHMAERWGRVSGAGLIVPLHFTHETLGRLIGARRPTVSLALKELSSAGLLERRRDGAWLLRYAAFDMLAKVDPSATWQPAEIRAVAVPDERSEAKPDGRGVNPAEVAALHARVAALRDEHGERIQRCVRTIERSRSTRRALRDSAFDRARPMARPTA